MRHNFGVPEDVLFDKWSYWQARTFLDEAAKLLSSPEDANTPEGYKRLPDGTLALDATRCSLAELQQRFPRGE